MSRKLAFLAGGGGFLGAHAASALRAGGYSVVSFGLGSPPSSAGVLNHHEGLIARALLATAVRDHGAPDVVIHAAGGASVGRSWEDPRGDFDLTAGSTAEILDFLRHDAPETRLVYISSAAVYGAANTPPLREDMSCAPMSPYGVHKRACEELVLGETRIRGLGAVLIRFFSLYGEGLRKQLLWDLLERASADAPGALELWGDGGETRDFLHAEDAARIIALAADAAQPNAAAIYNGASGTPVSVQTLATKLMQAAGIDRELVFNGKTRVGDPRHLTADVTRLNQELGFSPSMSLEAGLGRYVDWRRQLVNHEKK